MPIVMLRLAFFGSPARPNTFSSAFDGSTAFGFCSFQGKTS